MVWIRNFEYFSINKRQVGAYRHAVIEETGVLQATIVSINVLFVERPADALGRTTLELTLHIIRMNGFTGILNNRVADHLCGACFRIHFNVTDMAGKRYASVVRDHFDHIHRSIIKIEAKEVVPIPGHPDVTIDYEDLLALEERRTIDYYYPKINADINVPDLLDGIESKDRRDSKKDYGA